MDSTGAGPAAFEDFDRAYRSRLLRAALKRHAPDADAAVQEAMIAVSRRIGSLPRAELLPYAHGVLRRVVADQFAQQMQEVPHADPAALLRVIADPEAQAVERVQLDRVQRRLPRTWARSLQRRADGFTTAEVAAELGTTPENARQITRRAAERARRMYAGGVAALTVRRIRHRAWSAGAKARAWLTEQAAPFTAAQFVVASVGVLSITAFVGATPLPHTAAPTGLAAPALHGAGRDRVAGDATTPEPRGTAKRAGSGHVWAHSVLPTPSPNAKETCAEPAGCVGTGPTTQDAGDTIYLIPFGPDGPHYNEKTVKACEYVTSNPVVGCRREGEPQNGWPVEPPPPPPSPSTPGGS